MNQQTKRQLKQLLSTLPPHRSGKPIAVITPVPGVPVNIAVVAGIPEHAREQQTVLDALNQAVQEHRHDPRLAYIPLTATATPSDIAETLGITTAFTFLHIQDSFIIALGAGTVALFASHVIAVLEDRRRCHAFAHNVRSLMRALSTKQLRAYPTNRVTFVPHTDLAFCLLPSGA